MKIILHYGDGVLTLPAAISDCLPRADGDATRVLLALAASPAGISRDKIAATLQIDPATVDAAIAFWRGAGILDTDTARTPRTVPVSKEKEKEEKRDTDADSNAIRIAKAVEATASPTPTTKPTAPAALPRYTAGELANLLETRRELRTFLEECGHLLGKILSAHETNILLSLMDYLNVDSEYLLLLLAHCIRIGKKSVRYMETYALALYDDGIIDVASLQSCLKEKETMEEAEGKIRTLFGIQSRALTAKEQKMLQMWILTWKFDMDVIRHAYEMTVDATQKPSVYYANSILERWATSGLHTLPEIEAADAVREGKKANPSPDSSFNIDDFFQAALRRSLGEDFVPPDDLTAHAGNNAPNRKSK